MLVSSAKNLRDMSMLYIAVPVTRSGKISPLCVILGF